MVDIVGEQWEATVQIKAKFKAVNRKAEMTIDTIFFSIMVAMLMSEKVKTWTPTVYPHLLKSIDRHYSAVGISSGV